MTKNVTFESSTKFARILAEENIAVTFSKTAKTASMNVITKAITLPTYSADLDVNQVEGFILHETAHARYTPVEYVELKSLFPKTSSSCFNICEDNRIERKMKAKYDGANEIFFNQYKTCFFDIKEGTELNWFGTTPETANKMGFIDKINILSKVGPISGITFNNPTETALFDAVNSALTFNEMVLAANSVWDYFKEVGEETNDEEAEEAAADQSPMSFDESEESDEEQSDETPDYEESDEEETNEDSEEEETEADFEATSNDEETDEESEEEETDETTDEESEDESEQSNDEKTDDSFKGDDCEPELEIDENWESITEEALDDNLRENSTSTYGRDRTIPSMDAPIDELHKLMYVNKKVLNEYRSLANDRSTDNSYNTPKYAVGDAIVNDLVTALTADAKRDVAALVSSFKIKQSANNVSRTKKYNTGEINEDELANYKISDDIFLTDEITTNQQNHAFYSLIDLSGSMLCRDSNRKFSDESLDAELNQYGYAEIAKEAGEFRSDWGMQQLIVGKLASMETRLYNVLKQSFVNALFCKELGLPFKTVGFTTGAVRTLRPFDMNEEELSKVPNYAKWSKDLDNSRNNYDSRMSLVELFTSDYTMEELLTTVHTICHDIYCNYNQGNFSDSKILAYGGTPGSLGIYLSINDINAMKAKYNVENIVVNYLSDGDSSYEGIFSNDAYAARDAKMVFDANTKKYLMNPTGGNGASYGLIHLSVLALKAKVANCTFIQFSAIGKPKLGYDFNREAFSFKTKIHSDWCPQPASVKGLKKDFYYIVPQEFIHPVIDKQYMILIPSLNETDDIDAAVEEHRSEKKVSQRAMVNYTLRILEKKAKLRAASKLLNLDLIKLVA